MADAELELTQRLDKRRRFNVTHRAAQLDNAHVRRLAALINRQRCHTLNPVLNGISQVRHNLHRLTEVVTATLLLDDLSVDLACGDIIVARQRDIQVTLIISQIQVDLATIVQHKHLTVLCRCHGTRVNVHVRVDLDGCHSQTQRAQQQTCRGCDHTLAYT